jgi:preprotein translocase subunit YajC
VFLAADSSGGGSSWTLLLMMALIFGALYFLMIRPQQRRRRQVDSMQSSLGIGDEVVTIGGLYGTVVDIDDETVTLEVAPEVENRYARGAISRVVTPAGHDEAEDDEGAEELEADDVVEDQVEPEPVRNERAGKD